jgi:hypothetical protein
MSLQEQDKIHNYFCNLSHDFNFTLVVFFYIPFLIFANETFPSS